MTARVLSLFALSVCVSSAQLTTDQRLADFRNMADLYARRYSAIQWKQQAVNFNALDLTTWLPRVAAVNNDLDFYDLMVEYVSDLVDAHDQYQVPSDFEAYLGFTVDIYDGKYLIDSIDPLTIDPGTYPFQVGDQLVSVDGFSAADLVKRFSKYVTGGNPRTIQRLAAELITDRIQAEYPYAVNVGDSATVVILRQGGNTETYTIPWNKTGTPLKGLGASPGPKTQAVAKPSARPAPYYQQWLQQLHNYELPGRINVLGFDETAPVFSLPRNFTVRLGRNIFDDLYTGRFTAADGTRVGFLRIPDFIYPSTQELDKEINWFQANTDVLVVDITRNPGGDACLAEAMLSRLTTQPFQGVVAEFRVDWGDVLGVSQALDQATADGLDPDTIALLQLYQTYFSDAFYSNAGRTPALPICASTTTRQPATNAYAKPVLLLTDEMSASSADLFAAVAQDNHIAPILGFRTMGAGGSPDQGVPVGIYTEGFTSVTRSLAVRPQPVTVQGYPTTNYVENVGVQPDTVVDYMTLDNLLNKGATFVQTFTDAVIKMKH
jgi:hypothetical protein